MITKSRRIICDIQPQYQKCISFNLPEATNWINEGTPENTIFFFVGPELDCDTKEDVMDFFVEYELKDEFLNQSKWIDKNYAFFRDWMDQGISRDKIVWAVKWMIEEGIYDSRDLEMEVEDLEEGNIYLPSFDFAVLKEFDGAEIIGGGRNECLEELTILLDAMEIKYTINNQFVY